MTKIVGKNIGFGKYPYGMNNMSVTHIFFSTSQHLVIYLEPKLAYICKYLTCTRQTGEVISAIFYNS